MKNDITYFHNLLHPYLPQGSFNLIASWIKHLPVTFDIKISRSRSSKFGDFRPPFKTRKYPLITINKDLPSFEFFIIFIHEWAHLTVWYKYGNKVEPHGKEWKDEYTTYLSQALLAGIFPGNISLALAEHIQKPVSSVCYDEDLFKILKKYHNPDIVFLSDLPEGAHFMLNRHWTFIKGPKLRKRYKCRNLKNGRWYLVAPHAEVIPLNPT